MPGHLSDYPYVIVRLRCDACERKGAYRLGRLAHKWGAEISLDQLLFKLSADCGWRRAKHSYREGDGCHVYFCDLRAPPRPPDLPPGLAGLRLIKGGKTDEPEEVPTRRTRKATP
ncbi:MULTISPECIES: hypothetical protein [unclassified Beijerinckia]|uniref:hypothetical protein n=1 Tax=unclassified Beijerinckia TaxID=2638183 RepID=UPI000897A7FA|nr:MULTISPECIES: hypothetical protein [unclassified Beijerinckia]MDH7797506.1 hypothetical protein [Beijerinckia sp. GAS462]SEC88303.1 hypothetical protein SAMN05443249_3800 [Beijerinckia sp. 28-YEA-48]